MARARSGIWPVTTLRLFTAVACAGTAHSALADTSAIGEGPELYHQHCAVCHDASDVTHAPTPAALKQISPEAVLRALGKGGLMEAPGKTLTADEQRVLALYLTGRQFGAELSSAPKSAMCTSAGEFSKPFAGPYWNGWGVDAANSRFQPARMAGLAPADVPKLKLKWAFAFPEAFAANAQPAVVGDRLFVGSTIHTVYSLDVRTGCIHWTFEATANVRTGMELARAIPMGRLLAYFGDARAQVYAVDAVTGNEVWRVRVDDHPIAGITGTVKVYHGMVFVPLMSGDDAPAADPKYECCKMRGALIALDAATGKQIWRTDTIAEPARRTALNKIGTPMWGPSGASIWSSPTLDLKRNVAYVTTGDNHSAPATTTSDAVLAIDMKTGKLLWSRQFTAGDTFNVGCLVPNNANCPEKAGPDQDFGSSAVLVELGTGKRVLIAAQKSGVIHAIDPDRQGALVWESRVAAGGLLGGVEWGIASDGRSVYVPVSDFRYQVRASTEPGRLFEITTEQNGGGGLIALDTATGRKLWAAPSIPCLPGRPSCSPAQMAAATVIPGIVFSGSLSGHIRAYSSANGSILWDFDTAREYDGVGGLKGRGGALSGPGPVVVDGMVYVNSGYDRIGVSPGNVLLAFEVGSRF